MDVSIHDAPLIFLRTLLDSTAVQRKTSNVIVLIAPSALLFPLTLEAEEDCQMVGRV
jgi:hypothetical protein